MSLSEHNPVAIAPGTDLISQAEHAEEAQRTHLPSLELFKEIIATYQRHGWELKRVLIKPDTRNELKDAEVFSEASLSDGEFDALWFARPSQGGREAWELRLVAENPYALFAAFESDETEEEREEARLEMEHQMREHSGSASEPPAGAGG
ncbi:MAG: hypothetical protein QOI77_3188 [Blastocatellia bacterium]|nr:hypothetical protein [Blastocatellia bacterium]